MNALYNHKLDISEQIKDPHALQVIVENPELATKFEEVKTKVSGDFADDLTACECYKL